MTKVRKAILMVSVVVSIDLIIASAIVFAPSGPAKKSTVAMQHRIDLLEQDVAYLEQRVVRLEDTLVEVLAVQAVQAVRAASAKPAEAKGVPVEVKSVDAPPVSTSVPLTLPVPPIQVHPVRRRSVVRRPASQGTEYPEMRQPYPWSEWENPAPTQ